MPKVLCIRKFLKFPHSSLCVTRDTTADGHPRPVSRFDALPKPVRESLLYRLQGTTGEIILLNLTDMVHLILDCLPAARKAAAAAIVGVATGSAAATALANAARTDKTIEDMRAGAAAGSGAFVFTAVC